MNSLAILGASGHGRVLADMAECCGWQSIVFFDDTPGLKHSGAWPIVGNSNDLRMRAGDFDGVIVAIGDNIIRHTKLLELQIAGAHLATLIHPSANVSRYAHIDVGCAICAGAVVSAYARIGPGSILNTRCSVDHDCVLGAAVHISPGASLAGNVQVGDLTWIGIGASVRQLIQIGSAVTIGAGAAVVSDIADQATVIGVPARPLIRHNAPV